MHRNLAAYVSVTIFMHVVLLVIIPVSGHTGTLTAIVYMTRVG